MSSQPAESRRTEGRQVVVLTGAGGRFGRILTRKLLDEPSVFPVLLTSDPARLELGPAPGPHAVHQVTLADPDSVAAAFAAVFEAQRDVDVLINNAAVITEPGFRDFVHKADDRRVLDSYAVNAAGALFCIRQALGRGRDSGKKVINVLAGRALTGHERHVEYYSSKAALYNATKTLAHDYPRHAFRNVMTGRIDLGDRGDSPDSLWACFQAFIREPNPAPYREVYLRPRLEFYWRLLQYYWQHFRSCERWDVERR